MHHRHLPDFFNPVNVPAHQKGFEVFFEGGVNGMNALGEGGASQAIQAGFGGNDLDDDQPGMAGLGQNSLDILNFNRLGHKIPLPEAARWDTGHRVYGYFPLVETSEGLDFSDSGEKAAMKTLSRN